MWKLTILLFLTVCIIICHGDLGTEIRERVEHQVGHLKNLGYEIQEQVQRNLAPVYAMTTKMNMRSGDLGSEIRERVEHQVGHLKNLGNQIQEQVQQNLAPVYAMTTKMNMRSGVGGVTTVSYNGQRSRNFIIRDGNRFECRGTFQGPNCNGAVEPFAITSDDDYCFASSYAFVNNIVCLSNSGLSVQSINDEVRCKSSDGLPFLMIPKSQYVKMCGQVVYYTYYSDANNPRSIPIPNSNPHVTCLNNEAGICQFTESTIGNNGNVVSSQISSSSSYRFYSY